MLTNNNNCYYIIYDGTMDGNTEYVYNWGGYYYATNRLAELLQRGMIKEYAEIHETDTHEVVTRVEIKKEVKA